VIQRRETAALGRLVNIYNQFGTQYNITNFDNYCSMNDRLLHSNSQAIVDFYQSTGRTILGFLQQPADVAPLPPPPPPYQQAVNPPDMPNLQPQGLVVNIEDLYNMRDQFLLNGMDNNDNNNIPNFDFHENGEQFLQNALNEIDPQNLVQQNQQVQHQQQQQVQEINVIVGALGHPTDAVAANNVGQNNLVFDVGDPVEVNPPPQNLEDRLPQEQQQQQQQRQVTLNPAPTPTAEIVAPPLYGNVQFRDLPQQRPFRFRNNFNNFRRNFSRNSSSRPTITTHILIEEVVVTDLRRNTSRTERTIQKTVVKRL
jgi:hypothetical protein